MISLDDFIEALRRERQYQSNRWGDGTDESLDFADAQMNDIADWVLYINRYSTSAIGPGFVHQDPTIQQLEAFKNSMTKVAAIAYAACRWVDGVIAEEGF